MGCWWGLCTLCVYGFTVCVRFEVVGFSAGVLCLVVVWVLVLVALMFEVCAWVCYDSGKLF